MGVVYLAYDERLEREVALKVLPPGTIQDEVARKRFRKEALALSKLSHPNIATVHDFDVQDGVDFIVMEYIPGVSLDEKLARAASSIYFYRITYPDGSTSAKKMAVLR
jgi:serine/threonine protein kinase